jgi:hypothetical protein
MDRNPESPIRPYAERSGVHLAYEIARDSYAVVCQRLDAVNARLQSLIGFAATVTIAAPVIVRSFEEQASVDSFWFVVAICLALIIAAVGLVALAVGTVTLLSPRVLHTSWLDYEDPEFKGHMISWASEHFDKGTELVSIKGWTTVVLTVLFLAEITCLLIWALVET